MEVRETRVGMRRVGLCMLLCCSQIQYIHMVGQKENTRTGGVGLSQKPMDLSASEREDRGHGKGVGVHTTLLQSDTVHPYCHTKAGTRPGGVGLCKIPKHLSVSEREERGHREGVSTEDVRENALCTYDVVCSRKTDLHL